MRPGCSRCQGIRIGASTSSKMALIAAALLACSLARSIARVRTPGGGAAAGSQRRGCILMCCLFSRVRTPEHVRVYVTSTRVYALICIRAANVNVYISIYTRCLRRGRQRDDQGRRRMPFFFLFLLFLPLSSKKAGRRERGSPG